MLGTNNLREEVVLRNVNKNLQFRDLPCVTKIVENEANAPRLESFQTIGYRCKYKKKETDARPSGLNAMILECSLWNKSEIVFMVVGQNRTE